MPEYTPAAYVFGPRETVGTVIVDFQQRWNLKVISAVLTNTGTKPITYRWNDAAQQELQLLPGHERTVTGMDIRRIIVQWGDGGTAQLQVMGIPYDQWLQAGRPTVQAP
ncbi:MAG: hypothetical protein OXR67_01420 [Chloroflexota bacterium]|nr:hypothetical protein [Chloroflexota bacterium]